MTMNKVERFCKEYGANRMETNSVKWDGMTEKFDGTSLLPLWIADMEFKVPKKVQETLAERVQHGVFGYTKVSDTYFHHYFNWHKKRYNIDMKEEWVRFSTGVVNSFYWMVNAFTKENDSVMIFSPVYYPFYDAIRDNNRKIVASDLVLVDNQYEMDFADIEMKIKENQVKLLIHCSPHNPVGRVWTRAELERLYALCKKHNVLVVSDEIHQDMVQDTSKFVGALTMSEEYYDHMIVLNSPSKTFNVAGLLNSHIVIPDEKLREHYDNYAKTVNNSAHSLMGLVATEACYQYGAEWLESLLEVIEYNYQTVKETLQKELPEAIVANKEGTYLAWIDLSAYLKPEEMKKVMEEKCKIAVDYGDWFGSGYDSFIRINLGTLPEYIEEALSRLAAVLKN